MRCSAGVAVARQRNTSNQSSGISIASETDSTSSGTEQKHDVLCETIQRMWQAAGSSSSVKLRAVRASSSSSPELGPRPTASGHLSNSSLQQARATSVLVNILQAVSDELEEPTGTDQGRRTLEQLEQRASLLPSPSLSPVMEMKKAEAKLPPDVKAVPKGKMPPDVKAAPKEKARPPERDR